MVIELAGHPQIIGLVDGAGGRERIEAIAGRDEGGEARGDCDGGVRGGDGKDAGSDDGCREETLIAADTLTGGGAALAVAPTKPAVKTRTKVVGFQMLAGSTTGMLEGLQAGAVGAMPAFAAAAPQACYEVLAAWKDGDEGLAEEKQVGCSASLHEVEEELGVAGIKFGCDLNGYFGGRPRSATAAVDG